MPDIEKHTILLTLHRLGEAHRVQTFKGQYYSLMTLIAYQLPIPGFGLCSGMGSCGTCLVQVTTKHSGVTRSVLACDVQIDDELSNTDIIIPDRMY